MSDVKTLKDFLKEKSKELLLLQKDYSDTLVSYFGYTNFKETTFESCAISMRESKDAVQNFFEKNGKLNEEALSQKFREEVLYKLHDNFYDVSEDVYKFYFNVIDQGNGKLFPKPNLSEVIYTHSAKFLKAMDFKSPSVESTNHEPIVVPKELIKAAYRYCTKFENFYGSEFSYGMEIISTESLKLLHVMYHHKGNQDTFNNTELFRGLLKDKILPSLVKFSGESTILTTPPDVPGTEIIKLVKALSALKDESRKKLDQLSV